MRIITRHPERAVDERWEGRLPDSARPECWTGPTIEAVIGKMDRELGPVPEERYRITE